MPHMSNVKDTQTSVKNSNENHRHDHSSKPFGKISIGIEGLLPKTKYNYIHILSLQDDLSKFLQLSVM